MAFVRRLLELTVLAGVLLACAGRADDTLAAPVTTLRMLTHNVLADEVHVRERVPELLRILRESEADIIALQEVAPWFAKTLLREKWTAAYQRARQDDRTVLAREFIVLSRFPVVDHEIIVLPTHQRQTAFRVTLDIDGVQTAVATTHLDSLPEDGPIRARQLDAIFALLAKFEEAVFLGDLDFGDGEHPESAHLSPEYRDPGLTLRSNERGFPWNTEKSPWARRESFPRRAEPATRPHPHEVDAMDADLDHNHGRQAGTRKAEGHLSVGSLRAHRGFFVREQRGSEYRHGRTIVEIAAAPSSDGPPPVRARTRPCVGTTRGWVTFSHRRSRLGRR